MENSPKIQHNSSWFLGYVVYADAEGIWIAMLSSMIVHALAMLGVYQFTDWQRFAMRGNGRKQRM